MPRDPSRRAQQQRRLDAYLTDAAVPDQERGWIMLALVAHAISYLLLTAAEAVWVVGTAVRVWRRRDAGLAEAVRSGAHRPSLAGLVAAHLLYAAARKGRPGAPGPPQRRACQEHPGGAGRKTVAF